MVQPALSVVIPTYNAAGTLDLALTSLTEQDYSGDVEIFVVDGGSTDDTLRIAQRYGARVVPNPYRNQEDGTALGVEEATGELLLVIDADDELPHRSWLARMVGALDLAPDIGGADALYHSAPPDGPAINRLAALIGGTDPVAIDLGWADRWGRHHDRWTTMPVQEEDRGEAVLVRIDPEHAPPMGSNGFLFRRDLVLQVDYSPFFHPEVVAQIAAMGYRFARVRDSVIHHFAPDTRTALRKVWKRAGDTAGRHGSRRVEPPQDPASVARVALWSLSIVGPAYDALRGYRRSPDRAWLLYPLWHLAWTLSYGYAYARRLAGSMFRRRPSRS